MLHFRIRHWLLALMLTATLMLVGCGKSDAPAGGESSGESASSAERPTVAFVTNQVADFWNIAEVGCIDAGKDFNVDVDVRMPAEATVVEQKRILEDLLTSGVDGIAISVLDSENERDLLNRAAAKVPLITHDADAPRTDRLLYIGMDNYKAGRMCGELVKQALPDGGEVMLFIGRLEQLNAKLRRQGTIDELLDRPMPASHTEVEFDPPGDVVQGDKYTILGTLTDQGLATKSKDNAEDAIATYPNLGAMVGLFEYNPPAMLQALQQAGKLGEIALIGFDENSATLQAIKDGTCVGTIVQNPYEYGYQSVKVLASIIRGDKSVIPESKYIDVPPRKITKENVDAFWADLKAKTSG